MRVRLKTWGVVMIAAVAAPVMIVAIAAPVAVSSQQRDARAVVPPGTGEIAGVVWSAGTTPQPLRRVIVSISGGGLPSIRSVITDDSGAFTFSRLSAGTFMITAKKPAYLPAAYGALHPGRPGSSIALAAGQRVAVNVTMFKGAVIGGTLFNASGVPMPGVTVTALDARGATGAAAPSLTPPPGSVTTDDRGVYRIYGLMPGEYMISASPSAGGDGEIGSRSAAEMDALLAALGQRPRGATATGAASPAPSLPASSSSVGYAPIYFPGTAWFSEAGTIRVAAGEEHEGVNFEVSHVRVGSIAGTVAGDVANLAAVQLALIIGGPKNNTLVSTMGILGTSPNARGEFKYTNVPPGQYRIIARALRGATEAVSIAPGTVSFAGSGGSPAPIAGGGSPVPNAEQLFAVADVDVRGQDLTGLSLQLRPGGTLSGKVVFDAGSAPVPADLSTIRVALTLPGGSYTAISGGTRIGNSLSAVPAVPLKADGTFQIIGIGPGPYGISCQLTPELAKVWKLRSAVLDGRELLDTLIEGPGIQFTGVTLTLSDKRTDLTGTLQSASGQPTADYYVIAFSTDRANWRAGSRRSLSTKPDTTGRFAFADLPAGEYFLAALTDLDPALWQSPAFLEQVTPGAAKVIVVEGARNAQDLRIR